VPMPMHRTRDDLMDRQPMMLLPHAAGGLA
jgi:hypothetical protein